MASWMTVRVIVSFLVKKKEHSECEVCTAPRKAGEQPGLKKIISWLFVQDKERWQMVLLTRKS